MIQNLFRKFLKYFSRSEMYLWRNKSNSWSIWVGIFCCFFFQLFSTSQNFYWNNSHHCTDANQKFETVVCQWKILRNIIIIWTKNMKINFSWNKNETENLICAWCRFVHVRQEKINCFVFRWGGIGWPRHSPWMRPRGAGRATCGMCLPVGFK